LEGDGLNSSRVVFIFYIRIILVPVPNFLYYPSSLQEINKKINKKSFDLSQEIILAPVPDFLVYKI
jgi:hypothetical protein